MSMIKKEYVSCIIPVYKVKKSFLIRCLDSVRNQQTSTVEVHAIVVFDGVPDDDLIKEIKKQESELIRFYIKEHGGVSDARNYGIEKALGEWICFLDADDELIPGAISKLLEVDYKSCEIIQGAIVKKSRKITEQVSLDSKYNDTTINGMVFRKLVLEEKGPCPNVFSKIYSLQLLKRGYRFKEKLETGEDTEFVFRVCSPEINIYLINIDLYIYHRNTGSAVTSFNNDYLNRIIRLVNEIKYDIDNVDNTSYYSDSFHAFVSFHLLLAMVHYVFNTGSGWSESERKIVFKEILNNKLFEKALRLSKTDSFSIQKRITIIVLKYKLYYITKLISFIRNKQIG